LDDGADSGTADEVVAHLSVRDGLDGDGDGVVGGLGGQRVRPPLADSVDVDPDAHVLARGVASPSTAWLDDHADGVARLGMEGDDAAAEVGTGAERVDDVEVVGGHQGCRHAFGEPDDPCAQRADGRRPGCCRRHSPTLAEVRV
jgi:hypothetical protein